MAFGKIRIDKNDQLFSKMIRERDKRCVLCGDTTRKSECSHFWARGNKRTRFDARNAEYLCFTCHMRVEGNKQGVYRDYKMKQLGEKKYEELRLRAMDTGKYGEYEKKTLYEFLKKDYKEKRHLSPEWGGYDLSMSAILKL